jgi:hypothetical protein
VASHLKLKAVVPTATLLAVLAMVTSCGGSTVVTQTVTATEIETVTDTVESTNEETSDDSAGGGPGELGDTITLSASLEGEQQEAEEIAVTVKRVTDPGKSAKYHKLVFIDLVLRNTGTLPYDDLPGNGAQLIDGKDRRHSIVDASLAPKTPACPDTDNTGVKIAPGESAAVCLKFKLEKQSKPKLFQFALASGFAEQLGEWQLTKTTEDSPSDEPAQLGDTITLSGSQEGEEMAVTVKKVSDPAKEPKYYGSSKGHRLVIVDLVLRNTGTTQYNDAPLAVVIDTTRRRHSEVIRDAPECPYEAGGLRIAPGGRAAVCVIFDIGTQRTPGFFWFRPSSGSGAQAGRWQLSN